MTQLLESSTQQFDRLPPHSIEAEMCLLASMMMDVSKEMVGKVSQIVDDGCFFQADHSILYKVLVSLYEQNRPIDAMIVRDELEKRHLLDEIGGVDYLMAILSSVPNAANGEHYAGIVREKATLRQIIAAGSDMIREAYAPHQHADEVLEEAEKRVFAIAERKVSGAMTQFESVLHEVFEQISNRGQRGIETGFLELDEMLNGLQNEMIVVAARPSMGKTALCMQMVEHIASDSMLSCAVFSLEMSKQQLAQRMLCARSGIDAHRVRKGMIQAGEYARMTQVISELARAEIWVDDSPGLTVMDLRTKARRLKREHDIKVMMIDYLQLMDCPGPEVRQQQVSEISRGIKSVARELAIPVIAVSQLNRQSEGRDGHRPRMSDLRDSGSIEQDADTIMLIHREDYYHIGDDAYTPDNIAELIIAKQRNGPIGTVKLMFQNKTTRFENLSNTQLPY